MVAMTTFEGQPLPKKEITPGRSAHEQNELQIQLMKRWAEREGKLYSTNNELALAWITSGNAKRYREHLEDNTIVDEPDIDALLSTLEGETLH